VRTVLARGLARARYTISLAQYTHACAAVLQALLVASGGRMTNLLGWPMDHR
jgi:hypothetical protein